MSGESAQSLACRMKTPRVGAGAARTFDLVNIGAERVCLRDKVGGHVDSLGWSHGCVHGLGNRTSEAGALS